MNPPPVPAALPLFFISSLISSLALYLWCKPRKWELAATFGIAALLCVFMKPGGPERFYTFPMTLLGWWGGTAIVFSMLECFAFPAWTRALTERVAITAIPPVAVVLSGVGLTITSLLTPVTFDFFLYAADASYGLQPGFWGMRFLLRYEAALQLAELAYFNLPLGMTLVYLHVRRTSASEAARALNLFILVAVFGIAFYNIFPSAGSVVTFGERFPDSPPALTNVPVVSAPAPVNSPRNCIPSLHTSWILALLWCDLTFGRLLRIALWVFSGLTLFYTMSCGHYLVDLVTAFPFTLAVYALNRPEGWSCSKVRGSLLLGSGLFVGWLALLRFGTSLLLLSPAIAWGLSAVTVGLSWIAWLRLNRVEIPVEPLQAPETALAA